MAGGSVADVALGAGDRIGRYFNLVSVLPSTFLVLYGYALIASGAWTGRPDWSSAYEQLTELSLGTLSILVLLALGLATALHPLQFAMTQLFEGYWGLSRLGESAAVSLIHRHRQVMETLLDTKSAAAVALQSVPSSERAGLSRPQDVTHVLRRTEADRLLQDYPRDASRILPTRLGNALRRGEDLAGRPYGLPAVGVTPHLALIAPPEHVAYLDDQRAQLDASIRLSLVSLLATGMAVAFLWSDGAWLAVAFGTYALAYLSYRGAVVVAREYGVALATLMALNRFALYQRMHVATPESNRDERLANRHLSLLLRGDPADDLAYVNEDPPGRDPGGPLPSP